MTLENILVNRHRQLIGTSNSVIQIAISGIIRMILRFIQSICDIYIFCLRWYIHSIYRDLNITYKQQIVKIIPVAQLEIITHLSTQIYRNGVKLKVRILRIYWTYLYIRHTVYAYILCCVMSCDVCMRCRYHIEVSASLGCNMSMNSYFRFQISCIYNYLHLLLFYYLVK